MFRRLTLTNVDTGLSSGATSRSSIPLIQLHISTVTGLMWHGAKFGGFHGSQMLVWLGLGTETLVKELKFMQQTKLIKKLKGFASANAKTPSGTIVSGLAPFLPKCNTTNKEAYTCMCIHNMI